jgi:hypothetical protein
MPCAGYTSSNVVTNCMSTHSLEISFVATEGTLCDEMFASMQHGVVLCKSHNNLHIAMYGNESVVHRTA